MAGQGAKTPHAGEQRSPRVTTKIQCSQSLYKWMNSF